MITAIIIEHLLFFPSPITREPVRDEISITQWGAAYIGVAHNDQAGAAFYQADNVRVLINNVWVEYQVVESGVYLCDVVAPNCNDAVFMAMYEKDAIILVTCWPRGGEAKGQFIINMLPTLDSMYKAKYTLAHGTKAN